MTQRSSRLLASILVLTFSACSAKQVREESYTPSQETVRIKSNMPVVELWDRWDEKSNSHLLVDGKHLITWSELPTLLADSSSSQVVSKVQAYQRWYNVSQVTGSTAIIASVFALTGYIRKDNGDLTFSLPTINVFWLIATITGGTAITSYLISEQKLRDAISLHNDSISDRSPTFVLNWEARF